MLKPGCVPATIYFRHKDGHLTLAPFSDCPTPPDAIREEVNTIPAIMRMERILRQQEVEKVERENEEDFKRSEARHKEIRERCLRNCKTDYEREFMTLMFKLRDEQKLDYYQKQLEIYQTFHLHALHHDLGERDASKEEVNLDKINF